MATTDIERAPSARSPARSRSGAESTVTRIRAYDHVVLILGVLLMMGPIFVAFMTSTYDHVTIHREGMQFGWGGNFGQTYADVLWHRPRTAGVSCSAASSPTPASTGYASHQASGHRL